MHSKSPSEELLVVRDVWKRYPGVVALKGVSISVRRGEILGLVGENGAGKSTLLKILFGVLQPDKGKIMWEGREVRVRSPIHAMELGMFYVPQELLIPSAISVAEALSIGVKIRGLWKTINYRSLGEEARKVLSLVGLEHIDPRTPVRDLDTPSQQLVLIARALLMRSKLIIMDEPTSALGSESVERLLDLMLKLRESGISLVFVSHRLEEVLRVADRIVVLRDGRKVAEYDNAVRAVSVDDIIKVMIAREIREFYPKEPVPKGEVILEVRNLSGARVEGMSFNVHGGEILGVFGLLGSGALDLPKLIVGVLPRTNGEIYIRGKRVEIERPADALKHGIIYVPEDRRRLGVVPLLTVKENITLGALDMLRRVNLGLVSPVDVSREVEVARGIVGKLGIVPSNINGKVMFLSGGNQQKVVISRAFARPSSIIIFSEPTIGIDVGVKVEVRRLMVDLAKRGNAVILVSSDVHEIYNMCDRVIVMAKGRKTGEVSREEASPELLMKLAVV